MARECRRHSAGDELVGCGVWRRVDFQHGVLGVVWAKGLHGSGVGDCTFLKTLDVQVTTVFYRFCRPPGKECSAATATLRSNTSMGRHLQAQHASSLLIEAALDGSSRNRKRRRGPHKVDFRDLYPETAWTPYCPKLTTPGYRWGPASLLSCGHSGAPCAVEAISARRSLTVTLAGILVSTPTQPTESLIACAQKDST